MTTSATTHSHEPGSPGTVRSEKGLPSSSPLPATGGRHLVDCCIEFAKEAGYSTIVLWT